MKLFAVLAVLLTALAVALTAPAVTGAQAPCQANPDPVDAADPSVIVDEPASGASVTSPLHVEGQARVFEAVVSLALYDAAGDEITSTTANAAEGQVLSEFSSDISFSVTADTPACLWVFESSAQDGSPTNVVQVPLTLRAVSTLPPTGTGASADDMTGWLVAGLAIAGVGLLGLGRLAANRS